MHSLGEGGGIEDMCDILARREEEIKTNEVYVNKSSRENEVYGT